MNFLEKINQFFAEKIFNTKESLGLNPELFPYFAGNNQLLTTGQLYEVPANTTESFSFVLQAGRGDIKGLSFCSTLNQSLAAYEPANAANVRISLSINATEVIRNLPATLFDGNIKDKIMNYNASYPQQSTAQITIQNDSAVSVFVDVIFYYVPVNC
jgi:hypothetical protein